MGLTQTEREVISYCNSHDFISESILNKLGMKLEQEGNLAFLNIAMEKFREDSCPKCGVDGAFKWHFLGRLKHPDCGWAWYVGPGTYIGKQLKAVLLTGMGIGGQVTEDAEKKGERGCLGAIFGFILGIIIRLPFALLMIPIQAIISIAQRKPESKSSTQS
jgi:hypothetical protein